ncbi:C39 family peptidase [Secundilactobacillus oryzae]|uniref:C39 family peptidase n=1 Tax=Secundilactobacillus oryzae TaxID=1202668 RepID=UPI000AC680FA|nr:C39 family peptidase [Secundilactobacillus oryzae]
MKIKSVIVAVALVVFALVLKTDSVYASTTSPIYKPVVSLKKVSYYTKMRSSGHNYGLYHSGAYQTSEDNMHKIGSRLTYKGKTIHVTREQKTADGTWLKFTYNHTYTAWMHQNGIVKSFRYLSVPLIAQRPELPTGCEITATAMMLNYAGAKVSKMTLAKEMPRSSNPNKGFVGSPYSTSGWYVYPGGLKGIVKKIYRFCREHDRSVLRQN